MDIHPRLAVQRWGQERGWTLADRPTKLSQPVLYSRESFPPPSDYPYVLRYCRGRSGNNNSGRVVQKYTTTILGKSGKRKHGGGSVVYATGSPWATFGVGDDLERDEAPPFPWSVVYLSTKPSPEDPSHTPPPLPHYHSLPGAGATDRRTDGGNNSKEFSPRGGMPRKQEEEGETSTVLPPCTTVRTWHALEV